MSRYSLGLDPKLHTYVQQTSIRETAELASLREETAALPDAFMQIAPEQGQLLHLLIGLGGSRRILEIGTYTGYSTLWMALALPENGHLITCDVDDVRPAAGKPYWEHAGIANRIELRIAPALETMDALFKAPEAWAGSVDMIFVDADKENYDHYYERGLSLLRSGGLMAVDNTLWSGAVVDPHKTDDATEAIRAFNSKVGTDSRVEQVLVPIGDGMTLIRKR